jgi:GT2 family glycosyltransferase
MTGEVASPERVGELERGRLRGHRREIETQIARAEQDVALGWRYWARRWWTDRRRPRRGTMRGPLVSVITPVYDTDVRHLVECLVSVALQTYADWEHVVVDDGSSDQRLRSLLGRWASKDSRVRVVRHAGNLGIAAASRTALAAASGEYVVMLDHDDVLDAHALARLVAALEPVQEATFAYSDHDVLRADGRLTQPFYKPDFSPERLRNHNYVLHCVIARRQAVLDAGGFRAGFDGAQDHDLLLRLSEAGSVVHVPEVLYHWRQAPDSVAADSAAKPYAYEAGVRAVQEHCDRLDLGAHVEAADVPGVYRVRYRVDRDPLVSVIIPTRGAALDVWGEQRTLVLEAVRSIAERSTHRDLELILVVDQATPSGVLIDLAAITRVRIVEHLGEFNFAAKCNAGAAAASGELLLFLNDDTELIEPGSVEEMIGLALQPDIGMVGAKLLYADGTLQHAGHVYPGLVTHAFLGYPGDHPLPGNMGRVARECSGVTAAAAMLRSEVFASVGGFDPVFPRNFNDVDLSLRLRATGKRIVWTPHASWFHFESATRDPATGDDERRLVIERWKHEIEHDPYFNPNLQPHRSDWLERPGRSGAPPYRIDATGRRQFS